MAPLARRVADTINASLSATSRASYHKTFDNYSAFTRQLSSAYPLPLNIGHLLLYLASLQQKGLASSTIISKLSALNYFQRLSGHQDVTSHFLVTKYISGLNKLNPSSDNRNPITVQSLRDLHLALNVSSSSSYYILLYQAMYSLAFFAFLRPGEMTSSPNNLQFHQLSVSSSTLSITFIKFKHHSGSPVTILVSTQKSVPCPVSSMTRYIKVRGSAPGHLFCNQGGAPISYNQFRDSLILSQSFLQTDLVYHPHSFRIGAATYAALQGVPEDHIKRMGRWGSSAYLKYIRIKSFNINIPQ